MLRLFILPEHAADGTWHGCGHIRLLRPFTHPAVLRDDIEVVAFAHDYAGESADIVLVERGWRPGLDAAVVESLILRVRRAGARLWWMIDDNLFDPHPDAATESYLLPRRPVLRLLAREADAIITSTIGLADRLAALNPIRMVLPNLLDERLLPPPPPPSRAPRAPITIGYMGTYTHLPDLLHVLPALRRVLRRHRGGAKLELLGVSNDHRIAALLNTDSFEMRSPLASSYPEFLGWMAKSLQWDMAIAPLKRGDFNDAKSDIKLLDYGACSLAGIYSSVPAYSQSVRDGVTGVLVADDGGAWEAALELLITDLERCREMGATAHRYLLDERTLHASGHRWHKAISDLASAARVP